MHQDTIGTVMITQEEINAKAAEIGQQIEKDFAGEEVVLIGILRGAVLWMGDIMKNVNLDMVIDFMAVSSYGASTKSSGVVKINKDLDTNISGKNVIIVEDIVDSGHHSQLSERVSAESRCQVCEESVRFLTNRKGAEWISMWII